MSDVNEPTGMGPNEIAGFKGGAYAATPPAAVPYPQALLFLDRIRWSAVWAGLVVALAVEMILNLLGAAIGFSVFHVTPTAAAGAAAPTSIGAGTAIWGGIVALIALFLGGWTAARLSGMAGSNNGIVHGVVVWCVSLLFGMLLLMLSLGGVLGAVGSVLGGAIGPLSRTITPGAVNPAAAAANANAVASYMASVAWWLFITAVVALFFAALGGALGIRKSVEEPAHS